MNKRGFTLVELIIVVIIISFLATMGFTSFRNMKRSGLDREAIGNLKLIYDAEKLYKLEHGSFTDCLSPPGASGIIDCNLALKLNLSTAKWSYNVYHKTRRPPPPGVQIYFTVVEQCLGNALRRWELGLDTTTTGEPVALPDGTCQ